jgi:hypothetical protein
MIKLTTKENNETVIYEELQCELGNVTELFRFSTLIRWIKFWI